ncbi:MAG: phosphatase PAP2 family protein, partial [Verrucomicrobiota bacterium]
MKLFRLGYRYCVDGVAQLLRDCEQKPQGPVFRWFRWVVFPAAFVAAMTIFVKLTNFDLAAEQTIWRAGQDSWEFGTRSLWWFLHAYGTYPAIIVTILCIIGVIIGFKFKSWERWRRVFLYQVLVLVVGSGVITNLILKENWGRPRPKEVIEMGGRKVFEEVLTRDMSSGGKSFPCGHATMGFFFLGGFFIFRRYRRDWAWFFLFLGFISGWFMGVARMCQGGHFFSDVIWAGGVMYFTALVLYYLMGLHRGILREASSLRKISAKARIVFIAIVLAFLVGVALAFPYKEKQSWVLIEESTQTQPVRLSLKLVAGDSKFAPADKFELESEAWGYGLPTSKIAVIFFEGNDVIHYGERLSGWFSEFGKDLKGAIPFHRVKRFDIESVGGFANIALPE